MNPTERQNNESRQRFLAEVGRLLASSLDYEQTLANVCRLAVPLLADLCVLDLLGEDGQTRRLEVVHQEPAKASRARELWRLPAASTGGAAGASRPQKDTESKLYATISDEELLALARGIEQAQRLRELGLCSGIRVPMLSHGRLLGSIALLTVESQRVYDKEDLEQAQQFALQAAAAVDNARLYREQQQQEKTLRGILASSMDEVYVFDREGRCTHVSSSAARGAGAEASQMIGKTWPELRPELASMERLEQQRKEAMLHRQPHHHEYSFSDSTGVRHWEYVFSPLFDNGAVSGVILIIRDVTERKRAEQALIDADRRKNEFLAILAHDLRNPLAPIRNSVEILRMIGSVEPAQKETLEMISRQASYMSRLIDDFLDISRITQGKISLQKQRIDLIELVRSTVAEHSQLLRSSGLSLVVELPAQPLWVQGDTARLSQVLGHLLHNANDFTEAGGRVSVRLIPDPDERTACLVVSDTGIGMEGDTLARLFEPFSQADSSLARSRGGLGLGLALVKGLVELHGGSVEAYSPGPGHGSEFTIKLPLTREPAGRETTAAASFHARRPLEILLIEDNRDAAESLRMLLQMAGHRVTVSHAGQAGVAIARTLVPEVVLCDIGLPGGMDGCAVAHALRQDLQRLPIVLIAMSGYGQEEDRRKALSAGFDHYLTKPVELGTLSRLLDSLTSRPVI